MSMPFLETANTFQDFEDHLSLENAIIENVVILPLSFCGLLRSVNGCIEGNSV